MPTLIVSDCANTPVVALATSPAATRPVRIIEPKLIPLLLVLLRGNPPPEAEEARSVPTYPRGRETGPGTDLVRHENERSVGHHQPARGPQTEVAGERLHNPPESQTRPLKQAVAAQKPSM